MTYSQKIKNGLRALAKNDRALAGVILSIAFTVIMLLLLNDASIQKITDRLSIATPTGLFDAGRQAEQAFADYEVNNTSCLTVVDQFYLISNELFTDLQQDMDIPQAILNQIITLYPEENVLPGIQLTSDNGTYMLMQSTTLSQEEFNSALQSYLMQNPMMVIQGGFDYCAMTYHGKSIENYIHVCSANIDTSELCNCELLADIDDYCFVLSNMIKDQITSQIGDLTSQLGGETGGDLGGLLGALGGLG
jgi:hypothetical protein